MSLKNPMDLNNVTPSNYIQPSTSAPTANTAIATYSVGWNASNVSEPVATYAQPGAGAKDPYPAVTGLIGPLGTSQNPKL